MRQSQRSDNPRRPRSSAAGRARHRRLRLRGEELKELPGGVAWTTRLRSTAALHGLPPERTGRTGRPRLKGDRLPGPGPAREGDRVLPGLSRVTVTRYGKTETIATAALTCLRYSITSITRTRPVLRVAGDADEGGVQCADGNSGESGGAVGEVSAASARYRDDGSERRRGLAGLQLSVAMPVSGRAKGRERCLRVSRPGPGPVAVPWSAP